jgi:lipopolysaccharide/colanic/teichoic acid biosynthesis glycosyltransferase
MIVAASVGALFLRGNFNFDQVETTATLPYIVLSVAAFLPIAILLGINRTLWRFANLTDHIKVLVAVIGIVASATIGTFLYSRLDGIARSLPVLQGILMLMLMSGTRVLFRLHHLQRRWQTLNEANTSQFVSGVETVLVVGVNEISDLYLKTIAEFGGGRIAVAGLLGLRERHVGHTVGALDVLGMPEDIESILRELEVRGVVINRIVVTRAFDNLSPEAQTALRSAELKWGIRVDYFAEQLGLDKPAALRRQNDAAALAQRSLQVEVELGLDRPYWKIKRVADAIGAAMLLIVLSPVMLIVGLIVAAELKSSPLFWQQRPGRGGWPFRVRKFQTMSVAHDAQGRRLSDEERHTWSGRFLRRSRLDELPQLYNVLIGDMSFIGPRPLLPRDQPEDAIERLSVRPGLTGWAQANGGRHLSIETKTMLDNWYVRNASFWLDLKVLAKTVMMLAGGEKTNARAVADAMPELPPGVISLKRPATFEAAVFTPPKQAGDVAKAVRAAS